MNFHHGITRTFKTYEHEAKNTLVEGPTYVIIEDTNEKYYVDSPAPIPFVIGTDHIHLVTTADGAAMIAKLDAEAASRAASDDLLASKAENAALKSALEGLINANKQDIVTGDQTNLGAMADLVNAEASAREQADNAEAAARAAADGVLQDHIDGERALRETADARLQADIDAAKVKHDQDVATLQGEIDALETARDALKARVTALEAKDHDAFTLTRLAGDYPTLSGQELNIPPKEINQDDIDALKARITELESVKHPGVTLVSTASTAATLAQATQELSVTTSVELITSKW